MNTILQNNFDQLESQRNRLIDSLKTLPSDLLNHQPSGKWSINQIIAHIITAEKMSVMYLTKKIQGIDEAEDSGFIQELKMVALIISQRFPFKFKAPRVVVENTSTSTNLKELEYEWNTVRKELRVFLEKIKEDQIKKLIYKHVVMGKLNIQHALIFFREHIIHHQPQMEKLIRK
jgi:uncharacterized damage-inducible protein DinB